MKPPQHFETHAAWFLHRMIESNLVLSKTEAHALDLVFADYYRRTAEKLPRPVLIAYPIGQTKSTSKGKSDILSAQAGQHIEGRIQRRADGTPVMLVERILEVLKPHQEVAFRRVLKRWAQIKPEPISIPIIEVMRASKDPLLSLTPKQKQEIDRIIYSKTDNIIRAPIGRTDSNQLDPETERIRLKIVNVLTPRQREQFEASLTFVEEEIADWRALKTGGDAIYAEAVALLDKEAKRKKSTDK